MSDNPIKDYGFMDIEGDLKIVSFTEEQVTIGELRAHIEYMKEEGYTFLGVDTSSKDLNSK